MQVRTDQGQFDLSLGRQAVACPGQHSPVCLTTQPCRTPSSARSLPSQLSSRAESAATPLNTSYFDPDAYLRRLLRDTRLADLTSKHKAMLAEVGSLDSDMQARALLGWGTGERRWAGGRARWAMGVWSYVVLWAPAVLAYFLH